MRSKPKRVPLYAKATAAVAGALLLTLGGIQVGSHLEKSKRDDKQKELTEETFFSQKSQWADENYRL
ncbi:hypothetical protein KA013_00920 [Patescibacteria group bacterium]|nr:hypothetical protein [Patescibacteria group bacterium]